VIFDPGVVIVASDISLQAISFAQENAVFAGVDHMITIFLKKYLLFGYV
jgi:putative N6-adenine-specific DNA methylase